MRAAEPAWDARGLVAAIVQDADTAQVLMMGWMNAEALGRTRQTGRVTFWSRSREELWEKGATSGNWLELVSLDLDCDGDALLIQARPHGPVCHTGSATCWAGERTAGFAGLDTLEEVVRARASDRPAGSYTASLLEAGPDGPARKVVEEATEVLLAAKDHAHGAGGSQRVVEEAADLLYHLLVLLAERGIEGRRVTEELAARRR